MTVNGSAQVAVGTLLVGRAVGLGITGAAPTAGITDYSRKEVDDFGAVTIVERAWAKRMTATALIRSDALDIVADRIAAVRARPSLWIGQDGQDAITVYGFFKDFAIEVGESTSLLSLTIEGLSKAAPDQPGLPTGGTVAWPDVTDPDGTRPTNNADKTSENTAKDTAAVGGKPAGEVIEHLTDIDQAIAAAKAREDVLVNETIPAVDRAVKDAGDLIASARKRADDAFEGVGRVDRRIDSLVLEGGQEGADPFARAEIQRVEQAAIKGDEAAAQRIEAVETETRTIDSRIAASAEQITDAFTAADIAFAETTARLEVSSVPAALNPNAGFDRYPTPTTWPQSWTETSYLTGGSFVRRVTNRRGGFAMQLYGAGSAEAIAGVQMPRALNDSTYYVIEARWTLNAGSHRGSGILFRQNVQTGAGDMLFPFETLVGVGQPGLSYNFSRLVQTAAMGNARDGALVALSHFAPLGDIVFSEADITWDMLLARPATPAEIRDQTVLAPLRASVDVIEAVLVDLPNNFSAAVRTEVLEAQVNRQTASPLNDAINGVASSVGQAETRINARIEERASAIADGKVGSVVSDVSILRGEYNGTKGEVSRQAGVIVNLEGKASAYVRLVADAGNGRAALSLWSDQFGGAWQLTGNGAIDGNLTINGTITARAFNAASMLREASSTWTGSIRPGEGQTATIPWSLSLPAVTPQGRFIYEYRISVQTNANTSQSMGTDNRGRPITAHYVDDGGVNVGASDPQGNRYSPRVYGSQRVLAQQDFSPNFTATVTRGSQYRTEDGGDYVAIYISAYYEVNLIELKVTWVAV